MRAILKTLTVMLLCLHCARAVYDITRYGAIKEEDTIAVQKVNQQAFMKAVQLANDTDPESGQRVVKVPKGNFYFMPVPMKNIFNVSIIIEGKMTASHSIKYWPQKPNSQYYEDFISCTNCEHISISGGGKIDGRGYHWWIVCILNIKKLLPNQNVRPHLMRLQDSRFIKIHDIIMKNSPQFHLKMDSCYDAELYNINIRVNTTAQIDLFKRLSLVGVVPLFPLNTDGIDPSGARMHIYNITVQNYDDVVVPKPSHQGSYGGNCTEDMLVQNATVILGVGMSVGSVPPHTGCNCIRNITFRNVYITRPLKGIYVKTNPGDTGTGLVENIYYQNFTMERPIWWAIYIGPQQMKEPDGDGPGCMLYPFDRHGTCTTQPLVTLRNITLENVKIRESLLYPVTIRCNVTNPCKNINFINVRTDKWSIGQKQNGYVCEYASGRGDGNYPIIHCLEGDKKELRTSVTEDSKSFSDLTLEDYRELVKQMERAALEVGYEEENDQFDYSFDPSEYLEDEASHKILKVLLE